MEKTPNYSKYAIYISCAGLIGAFLSALIYGTWELASMEKRLSLEERTTLVVTEKINGQNLQIERINFTIKETTTVLQDQLNQRFERFEDKIEKMNDKVDKVYTLLMQKRG